MKSDMPDPGDRELQRSVRDLADAYEAQADPAEQVAATLEARLRRAGAVQVLGTVVLAVVVVAAVVIGVRALTLPSVGGPAEVPPLTGLFAAQEPDADGRCHAVRLYDSTPTDGRVAVWGWTAGTSCAERTDNLSTSLGRASGVLLPSGPGIAIEVAEGAPAVLEGLRLVIDPGAPVLAFPSVDAATSGAGGIRMVATQELDITYRPE